MRAVLTALNDELQRLKATGVKSIPVSEEALGALRIAATRARESVPVPRPAPQAKAPAAARAPAPRGTGPSGFPPAPEFVLPEGDKAARWAALRERVLNDPVCLRHLNPGRKVVFGVGSLDARIFFVGEAPGADEEIQGEPFVGAAGQLLNKMIAATGLRRDEVYIGNIMNWRPQLPLGAGGTQSGNRPPTQDEMTYCLPYLRAQIAIVNPDIVVALGATATQGLLGFGAFKALGDLRGQWREFSGKPLMVTYHPSYILRNPTSRSKRVIWEDFLKVMERAGMQVSAKQRGYFLDKGGF
jgi:DNA polymerase